MTQSEGFDPRGRIVGNHMDHKATNYACPCRDCVHMRVLEWAVNSHPRFVDHQ